jgi:GDPmannose 4,6-dehydratase
MPVALIIGISGQDGAYLAKLLLGKGYSVIGTSRDQEQGRFGNLDLLRIRDQVRLTSMATNDFRSIYKTVRESNPDEIYNLAGQTSVGLSFEQPMEAHESINLSVLNILECLRLMGSKARFYNAGSSECFGDTVEPAHEETAFRPRSPYATAKATAFWTVANYREAYGMPACSGILFNHESPVRPNHFVTRKIVDAAVRIAAGSKERLSLGNIDIHRDWGWAPEYVEAIWQMMQAPVLEDYVIATGQSYPLSGFLEAAFRHVGLNWLDHTDTNPALLRPLDITISRANPAKAADKLGWRAKVGFDELVDRLVTASGDPAWRPERRRSANGWGPGPIQTVDSP